MTCDPVASAGAGEKEILMADDLTSEGIRETPSPLPWWVDERTEHGLVICWIRDANGRVVVVVDDLRARDIADLIVRAVNEHQQLQADVATRAALANSRAQEIADLESRLAVLREALHKYGKT